MKKYEVSIVYRGQNTYIVEANSEKQALQKAEEAYDNGESGEQTGGEWEEIEKKEIVSVIS